MNVILKVYDLEAWKLARALRIAVSKTVKTFPKSEQFMLTDQLMRSARSVSANIAEGFGRHHYRESAQYYRQARGSLIETADHLICACDETYISKEVLKQYLDRIEECGRVLNGLIRYQLKHVKT